MTTADISVALLIRRTAMDWLTRSEGGTVTTRGAPTALAHDTLQHLLRTDPDGGWIAEMHGIVVGFSLAHVRGDIWFLAQLFVLPEMHSLGIGQELLRLAKAYGEKRRVRVYSVVASTSPVAQSLYMREGMFAIGIGYNMAGEVASLLSLPEPDASTKRIVDCGGWRERIAALDTAVYGAERLADHAWYLEMAANDDNHASFGLVRGGQFAGYGYAHASDAAIVPIAAWEPADQLPLLRMGAEFLHEREVGNASIWVVSLNHTVMSALLRAGWRVQAWSFFLASEPFGQFDRYHPAGGILL